MCGLAVCDAVQSIGCLGVCKVNDVLIFGPVNTFVFVSGAVGIFLCYQVLCIKCAYYFFVSFSSSLGNVKKNTIRNWEQWEIWQHSIIYWLYHIAAMNRWYFHLEILQKKVCIWILYAMNILACQCCFLGQVLHCYGPVFSKILTLAFLLLYSLQLSQVSFPAFFFLSAHLLSTNILQFLIGQ